MEFLSGVRGMVRCRSETAIGEIGERKAHLRAAESAVVVKYEGGPEHAR